MLSAATRDLARNLINPRIADRWSGFVGAGESMIGTYNQRGLLVSGPMVQAMNKFGRDELRAQIQIAFTNIQRTVVQTKTTYSQDLAFDLKRELEIYANQSVIEIIGEINKRWASVATVNPESMDREKRIALDIFSGEIDILVEQLRQAATAEKSSGGVYNFHGPVGAFQVGNYNIANVTQNLADADRAKVTEALDLSIQSLQQSSHPKSSEMERLAEEAREELTKPVPNDTKLLTILTVLSSAVEGIANARPAYEALRTALLFWGISLP
jgi:hypothetical protein